MPEWLKSFDQFLGQYPVGNVADWVELLALVVVLVGFTITVIGVLSSKSAAESAKESAQEAVKAMRVVQAVAGLQDMCNKSREIVRLLHEKKTGRAASGAFDLREAVARFQWPSPSSANREDWNVVIEDVRTIHERLESASLSRRQDASEREQLVHQMSSVHSVLSRLAAQTTFSGADSANSQ